MNYNEFLTEIRRSVGVAPQKEDPKAKTTAMRQKLRDTGDVGLKDTVAQVTGKPVTSAQQYSKAGKKIATAATGVEFGDTADPIDAALDKVRGPARYQALEKEKAAALAAKQKAAQQAALNAKKSEGEKKREQRKLEREDRKRLIEKFEKQEAMHSGEDPEDRKEIEIAQATFGDFKLKIAPDYTVPENQRVNFSKKR